MEKNKKSMPVDFGQPPRNIVKYHNGFKAEEWANWVVLYSMPLLKEHLPNKIIQGWSLFVAAVRLCQKRIISIADVNEIQHLILGFYNYYERIYYHQDQARLPAMKICFHYLLHLADTIKINGPCWSTWQFPMERLCGMLIPLVQSKLHPYDNLANQIILKERLNHLQFIEHIYQQVHPSQNKSRQCNDENIVFTNLNYEEELYFPTTKHHLNKSMVNKLKKQYSTCYETKIILQQFNDNTHLMAFVQWTQNVIEDEYGLKYFREFGVEQFIDVRVIDRCIGFLKCGNSFFIIDN
ncbi:hypothetical protein GLOIN_2v1835774 [Rhizophagus clarus]|uniref:DUF4218 domain-containing protein n=1 Tax=Rhizophagus clarus TaxID=94130 RepID=A0A8H3QGQ7_9GLOM|nr:hypothetical protein GLOIN_2v1835774 [Rhizophagus clarus]